MAAASDPLNEARLLASLIVRGAERVRQNFADAVEPFGIPVATARALLLLDEPVAMRALADRLACDQSYVTGLADDLEERGLITRVTGDDRRVKMLTLTPAGRPIRDALAKAVAESSPVMTKLSGTDRVTLAHLLSTVLAEPA